MLFTPEDEQEIKKRLSEITNDVKLVLFTQTFNCDTCVETEALMRALCELSERLKLEILNPHVDRERAEQYKVERVPALIVEGDRDYGIRFSERRAVMNLRVSWKILLRLENANRGLTKLPRNRSALWPNHFI